MKKLIPFLIILILSSCCSELKKENTDYNSMCKVGEKYVLYGVKWEKDNPFEKVGTSTVIILQKLNGYVEYCHAHDINNNNRVTFSRSCKQFIESTKIQQ